MSIRLLFGQLLYINIYLSCSGKFSHVWLLAKMDSPHSTVCGNRDSHRLLDFISTPLSTSINVLYCTCDGNRTHQLLQYVYLIHFLSHWLLSLVSYDNWTCPSFPMRDMIWWLVYTLIHTLYGKGGREEGRKGGEVEGGEERIRERSKDGKTWFGLVWAQINRINQCSIKSIDSVH